MSNSDIRIQATWPYHWKTRKLERILGKAGPLHLVYLWCWTGPNKCKGDYTGMEDAEIEGAAYWDGVPGAFIDALIQCRFLEGIEGKRKLHDWKDHNSWCYNFPERSEQNRLNRLGAVKDKKKPVKRNKRAVKEKGGVLIESDNGSLRTSKEGKGKEGEGKEGEGKEGKGKDKSELTAFIEWFYSEYERIIGSKPVYPQTEYIHLTRLYKKLIKTIPIDKIKVVCTHFLSDTGEYTVGHLPSNLARNWTRYSEQATGTQYVKPPMTPGFSDGTSKKP